MCHYFTLVILFQHITAQAKEWWHTPSLVGIRQHHPAYAINTWHTPLFGGLKHQGCGIPEPAGVDNQRVAVSTSSEHGGRDACDHPWKPLPPNAEPAQLAKRRAGVSREVANPLASVKGVAATTGKSPAI